MTADATTDSNEVQTAPPRARARAKSATPRAPKSTAPKVIRPKAKAKSSESTDAGSDSNVTETATTTTTAAPAPRPRTSAKKKAVPATAAATVEPVAPKVEKKPAPASAPARAPKLRLHKETAHALPPNAAQAIGSKAKKKEQDHHARTSQILEEILTKNPDVQSFTVEKILSTLGTTSFGTSLMFFAIPEVLPIPLPGISALVVLPTGVLGAQMASGRRELRLPEFLLKREVPRRALAAAIYAILPALRKAETVTKPRWSWATSPVAQRLLGVFVFLLALSIAFPIPGFNMPQAIAIFIIGLGLVEKDGLIICLGVVLGVASMALLGAVVVGLAAFFGF